MPTINFSLKDLENLSGIKITKEKLSKYLEYCKGEIEGISEDEAVISLNDTNLPYLWSVEGISRMIKRVSGKQKGIPEIKINKSNYQIKVDSSVNAVRPYISSFIAKGRKVDNYLLKQIIQLQEKLSENYGRRRQKLAIGIYPLKEIKFPVRYRAVSPNSISFVPLGSKVDMTPEDILKKHPKGIEYSWILKNSNKYPMLIDSENNVLSFPPIINSSKTGRVDINESEIFFEATGDDIETVNLASCIFAQALFDRGFKIQSVLIDYGNKKITTPDISSETIRLSREGIKGVLGIDLSEQTIKKLVEKAGHEYSRGRVKISPLRKDILHEVDIIEDIAIMYGYGNIKEKPLKCYTIGETKNIVGLIDKARELAVGLGYQETFSPVLNNKQNLYRNMNIEDFGTVEIEEYMSENFSCLRTWLMPVLIEVLSKNKHNDYPQKIFEQGTISIKKGSDIKDYERIALVCSSASSKFTDMKQVLDFITFNLELKYELEEIDHKSFIEGRVGKIIVNKKEIGLIGEINPEVLKRWSLKMPVVALELDLSELS